jgi:type 2 lantibiotic biosynthesis protein LanM
MNEPQNQFLETANYLGARICRDALWAGNICNWLGPSMEFVSGNWTVVHRAYGPDLYAGTSGIALFLANLYRHTDEKIYRLTAEAGFRHSLSRLDDLHSAIRCGFYSGWVGIAFALTEAAVQLGNEGYVAEALRLLKSLAKDDPNAQGLDVISGSAGAIPFLLDVHQKHANDFLLELAIRHGEHLLTTARKNEFGWSWNTMDSPRDLTGFSHGTAGIALALLELHAKTGEPRFRDAADQAFRYERHYYNAEQENWPDFRSFTAENPEAPTVCSVTWCHGAPGIGLSRLRAYELTGQEVYRDEASAALRTTARMLSASAQGLQDNFSLCHGACGNAELLICASEVLGDPSQMKLVSEVAESGIERYRKTNLPWPCGVPGGGETPNLMLGLAGIGYFYLRVFDPSTHRPLLLIQPKQ